MSNPYKIDWNEYAALARQAVAEGCVLLKNDDKALPIRKGERVSVFGRIQFDYYKSGTGSGGAVNTRYVTNILDALKENKDISVNEELEQTYRDWLKDHPFEKGMGWAQEPWWPGGNARHERARRAGCCKVRYRRCHHRPHRR